METGCRVEGFQKLEGQFSGSRIRSTKHGELC